MRDMDFTFEETPWEVTRDTLKMGGSITAAHFLTLMEGEAETAVQDALQDLQDRRIRLDISDLPHMAAGEAAVRDRVLHPLQT